MAEFVEGYHEHFEGPEGIAQVWKIPEQSDDHDICDDDAECCFLRAVDAEAAAEEVVVGGGEVYSLLRVTRKGKV